MIPLRSLLLGLALLPTVALVSCGSGQTVDNDTCPYDTGTANGPYDPNPPVTNGSPVGQYIPEMPHNHVDQGTKVQYEHQPPTSGCHYNLGFGKAPILPGAYTTEIAPEYWVHNLEHGYMAVLYNCPGGCDADFQAIRTWMAGLKPDPELQSAVTSGALKTSYSKVVAIPYAEMPVRFAAVVWDYYDPMTKLDVGELQRFYDNHLDADPEAHASGSIAP